MNYKVSVIIPTYNAGKFIKSSVESVINQSIGFENIELILVDDNSTDSTKTILKQYAKEYDNIKCLFPEGNSGTPSRGRNFGIDNASSKYIMFLDQDDRYVNNICEVLYNVISKSNKDIAMCNHEVIFNNAFEDFNIKQDTSYNIYSTEDKIIFNDAYMWNKIFKKDFLNNYHIRCFEKYWGEDSYFCINSYLNTDEVAYLENFVGYVYNVRDSDEDSSSNNNYTPEDFDKYLKGFYKIIGLIKDKKRQYLINQLMKKEFVVILSQFVRLNTSLNTKKQILNELYDFKLYCKFNERLDEKWADIILKLINKKRFNVIILYSKCLNLIYNSKYIRQVYRNFYNKT